MNTPRISVIAPMYKVEKYLPACIESVLAQTETDWELLLVDDGSPDASGEIALGYQARDPRVRVLRQANAGVSAARNAGLEAARGEYIAFLDSDDRYEPELLAALREALEREEADMAACGARVIRENGEREPELLALRARTVTGEEAVMENFLRLEQGISGIWNKLYRRSTVGDVRFRPYVRAQDTLFNAEVTLRSRRCAIIAPCLYDYLKRAGSVTAETFSARKLDVVRVWAEISRLTEARFPSLLPLAAGKTVHEADRAFHDGMASGAPDWPALRRELIGVHNTWYLRQFTAPVSGKKAAADRIFRLSPELYYRLAARGK